MIHWKRTLAGLALGVALGGTAHAKVLYTAPALADFTGEAVDKPAKGDRTNSGLRLPSAQRAPSEGAAVVREGAANRG